MKPQIANELKERLMKRIGQQIESGFKCVPLYNYIRYEQYRNCCTVTIKDGEYCFCDDITADYVITDLAEAKNGYTATVKVLGCERKGYKDDYYGLCDYDGFVFDYTTNSGRLSMPIKEAQANMHPLYNWF